MSLYSVLIARRTSDGRLFVVFERLDGEVNSVVTEMALKDVGESIHRDCFHEVEDLMSVVHCQMQILDLYCWSGN